MAAGQHQSKTATELKRDQTPQRNTVPPPLFFFPFPFLNHGTGVNLALTLYSSES